MKWRNLIVWILILAALGAFVYFYEFKGEAKRQAAKEKAEKLFDIKQKDVVSLTVEHGDEKTVLALEGGQWMVTSPVNAHADQNTINDIVDALAGADMVRSLGGLQNLAEYGLQPAKIHLDFKTQTGTDYSLDMGVKDFSQSNVYSRIPSRADVLLIPVSVFTSADKTFFQLRDRKIMTVDTEKTSRVEFVSGADHFVAEKSGTTWKLTQPISTRGDSVGISGFLGDIANSEVAAFVDQPDSNLRKYGLDPPIESLTLSAGEGNRMEQKLLLGAKAGDLRYAKLEGAPAIFEIDQSTADKIRPDAYKLRDKHLTLLSGEDLRRVTVEVGKAVYEYDCGNAKEGQWKVVQPKDQAGKNAREWKFWFPLEDMTADEILDPPKSQTKASLFTTPAVKVRLVDKSNHSIELRFSKAEKDSVWVQSSESKSVYRIAGKKMDDWTSGLKGSAE